jgi:hypothetical protein
VRVVDNSGVEHVERGHSGDVRLDLAQPLGLDHLRAHAVGVAAALQLDQPAPVVVVVATTTLPQTSCSMPCVRQNSTIDVRPATQRRALSDPGA